MTENIVRLPETEPQATQPTGFDYEKIAPSGEWGAQVMVPVYRSPDKTTYLVPITDEEDARWGGQIKALKDKGTPCHLLPAGTDSYTQAERVFAEDTLEQSSTEIRSPFAVRLHKEEALVFDPTSAKSVLDVMIATGQDVPAIRQARRAALRGESNEVGNVLGRVLELNAVCQTDDQLALALRTAYGLVHQPIWLTDTIGELAEKGVEAFQFSRIQQRLEEGVDPEVVKASVTSPEELRHVAQEGWKELITFARTHNSDLARDGIYTEVHKVGNVVIVMPAIASTNYPGDLGYVEFGGGHTLAEIYGNTELNHRDLPQELNTAIDTSSLLQLSKQLGIISAGPATLQRRCRTTFTAEGQPIIHIREDDPFNGRYGKMTTEQVERALLEQNISSDVVNGENIVVKTAEEADQGICFSS